MEHLFTYLNYRDYLRDYYTEKKEAHSFYSFRLFSQKAGFKSPNFLKLVIDNMRNISKESVFKFCKALRLNKKEADYFENLVFFNQADSLDEKNLYLSVLMKYRAKQEEQYIEKSEYAYYSAWYHPVIRELVNAIDFKNNYKKLGKTVVPSINAMDAEKSVKLLLKLNFIEPTQTGEYRKTAVALTTGPQVRSIAIANYHKSMINLGAESIERFKSKERDVESLTVSVSEQTYQAIMKKSHDFLMELLKTAQADKSNERVAQINLQVFPLSKKLKPERRSVS